jgi:hypothetical protein
MDETQTYQEVSKIILEELVLNPVDFKKKDYQEYFYNLKIKEPEKYERLTFDTNSHKPYSEDLTDIFVNFFLCGFIDLDKNIIMNSMSRMTDYCNSVK